MKRRPNLTIGQALRESATSLSLRGPAPQIAWLEAEVLLAFSLRHDREYLHTYPEKNLTAHGGKKFAGLMRQRLKGVPVAYLTGHKEFFGRDFLVNPNVLIPRPATETLVEQALEYLHKNNIYRPVIADIGTGSGCIAVTLARELTHSVIIATDISKAALTTARLNARLNQAKITFIAGDLAEPLTQLKIAPDIIIANLPYVHKSALSPDERHNLIFEPKLSLYANQRGLAVYTRLLQQIAKLKLSPSALFFEIDPSQRLPLNRVIRRCLPQYAIRARRDLTGRIRCVILERGRKKAL